ncbi:protein translocase subunit SecF [Pelotomaculum propionicicum]|uniref:protein translocase subunit SecF n=1 Tax=Pelotomaculum propionicicum TaxID=258475 RepID=UPI003B79FD94
MNFRESMPFHFIKLRKIWYTISILILVPGIISLFLQGLNLGIDFTGGSLLDLKFSNPTAIEQVRGVLDESGLEVATIQQSEENTFLIRTKELTEDESASLVSAFDTKLGEVTVQRDERVGPVMGRELIMKAFQALALASVLIVIYVAWRFEFKQGIAAIIAVLHDVVIVLGVFSIFQLEVESDIIAAVLTIVGFSLMDTIIIFDRIRENSHLKKKGEVIEDVINRSLWQTMARSINTTMMILFVLIALLVFGGATMREMLIALLVGIFSGAYSSIFNAAPLWYDFKRLEKRNKLKVAKAKA